MTFDGNHHYQPRQWLGLNGDGRAPDGSKLLPWVKSNYHTELACVCGQRPPMTDVESINASLKETSRVRSLRFGDEEAEQGRLGI